VTDRTSAGTVWMRDGREAGGQATFDAMVEVSPG